MKYREILPWGVRIRIALAWEYCRVAGSYEILNPVSWHRRSDEPDLSERKRQPRSPDGRP
jgi:hypothetical protein